MPVHPAELAIALAVMTIAAGVQSSIGFGLSVVAVPILAAIDPVLAPVPQLLVTFPLAIAMLAIERRHVDIKGLGWVLAGRIPGAVLGGLMLVTFSVRASSAAIALVVLAAVWVIASGVTLRRTPVTQLATGIASGISGLVASLGGPPLALLYREEKGATLRSSLAAIFIIGIALSIVTRAVAGEILLDEVIVAGYLLPATGLGFVIGRRLAGRIEGAVLRRVILIVSGAAAVVLLARAYYL